MADGNQRGEGGKATPIGADMIARAATGMKSMRDGIIGFFTPVPPQPPVAQETQGRAFDYPMGFNIVNQPRRDDGATTSFQTLRAFADNYDLLRLVIETRKDQLCGLSWNVVGREESDKIKNDDPRVKELEAFFRYPDKNLNWNDWLRMLVEDMLVIDAPTIYPRKKMGGGMFSLDVVDGATIKLLINQDGRQPLPPDPAYAQIIKGMPASHYTSDELIYSPRNRRSWKMYGYSPVEQVIMTVNIALRRQMSQLQYYTEGNIPEALASVPEGWTPEQVKQMQIIWDSLMEGNQKAKRHMKFIPGGVDVKFTREAILKDMFDEWLARIICYAFSVSPQALILMMNRATAETAAETAALEGLAPLQMWVKGIMDRIIEFHFGYDDLVFKWDGGEELDPKAQADIHGIYMDRGVLDADEVREDLGRDPRNVARPADSAAPPVPGSAIEGALPGQSHLGEGNGTAVAAGGAAPQLDADGKPIAPAAPQLDAAGNPIPTPTGGDATKVADTAMTGVQVQSLLEVIGQVAAKELPEETVKAIILAAFPSIPETTIDAMLAPLRNFEQPAPQPLLGPDGQPIAPGLPGGADDAGGDAAGDQQDKAGKGVPPPKQGKGAGAGAEGDDASAEGDDKKLGKARHNHISKERLAQKKVLTGTMTKALSDAYQNVVAQIRKYRDDPPPNEVLKAARAEVDWIESLLGKIQLSFEDAYDDLEASLTIVAQDAAAVALAKIKGKHADALDLANTRAEAWAEARAAELIKTGAAGGELAETTREMLRSTILEAEQEGWSNDHLASELRDNYAFSKQRAETIARTETKTADSQGQIAGWKASGLKMQKEWVRSANDYDCDICEANEDQGPIDLEDSFDSGDDTTPAHPNCECIVRSVIDEDQET